MYGIPDSEVSLNKFPEELLKEISEIVLEEIPEERMNRTGGIPVQIPIWTPKEVIADLINWKIHWKKCE